MCYFFNYSRKQTILADKKFDFLKELVENIPDIQANDDETETVQEPVVGPRPRGRWVQKLVDWTETGDR